MGIFGRTRDQAPRADEWYPAGGGLAGDVGGDIQAGGAFSVRYLNDAIPHAVVDVILYPVEYDDAPEEFRVQVQAEFLICEDRTEPGDTEVWSDARYGDLPRIYPSAYSAERAAEQAAQELDGGASVTNALGGLDQVMLEMLRDWDGETFQPGDW